jgi:hypothetical protein
MADKSDNLPAPAVLEGEVLAPNAIADHANAHNTPTEGTRPIVRMVDKVTCKDGFNFSAQASMFHYCHPRMDVDDFQTYTAWEIGFPSEVEPLLLPYMDPSSGGPTETVYGYVPTGVVNNVIAKHGGIIYPDAGDKVSTPTPSSSQE